MPPVIPYVSPDRDKLVFAAPTTPYSFHVASHTFSGHNTEFMTPDVMQGFCSIVTRFNYAGELEHGSIKVVGGISSMGIAAGSLLLQGSIINVDTFFNGGVFQANFLFRIEQDQPLLGYNSHIGVWNSYMAIPGWPEFFLRYLFRRNWGPAGAAMNSYIGQVKNIV
ncbi:MAG: hypothetical protein OEU36_25435 [Gammaproteobacteria bacterium]|nr:hypothetical protein [Gammaproteobacteria bacterium]